MLTEGHNKLIILCSVYGAQARIARELAIRYSVLRHLLMLRQPTVDLALKLRAHGIEIDDWVTPHVQRPDTDVGRGP